MSAFAGILSPAEVTLPRRALRPMLRLWWILERLSRNAAYRAAVLQRAPATAGHDPGHAAVMMACDFHLAPDGPRLIEVNTNAGGGLPAWLAAHPGQSVPQDLPARLRTRLLATFASELRLQGRGAPTTLRRVAIVDENPAAQFLYPEMLAFAALFRDAGIDAEVVAPEELNASAAGVFLGSRRIDLVYNRHCDFYLETPELAGLRAAYLADKVCLTPNPHSYALLADKRRLIDWRDRSLLARAGLAPAEQDLLLECIPESRLLADWDGEALWRERAAWIFKPVDRFGSRGVLTGEKLTRGRFAQLDGATTLVQRFVPPSLTPAPDGDALKTDLRLFAYRRQVLGVTARLYHGQVTNLRTPGGGFARVRLVP